MPRRSPDESGSALSPTSGPSAWHLTSEGGGAPERLALKAPGLQRSSRDWGTETPLWGSAQMLHTPRPRAEHWDSRGLTAEPTAELGAFSRGGRRPRWLTAEARKPVTEAPKAFTGVSSPEVTTWAPPKACKLQCWDASGRTMNRVEPQPHLSADMKLS